jgi:hypothetical protein
MRALIEVLNDLAWIHECLAMDHTGEAKSSMSALADRLERFPDPSLGDCANRARTLREARNVFIVGEDADLRQAVVDLMSMSRALWTLLLTEVDATEARWRRRE